MPDYDAIVIGTGQAGPSLALRLAGAGMKVAVVERNLVGGTCVNTGCTPTKTLVASAYAAHLARQAAEYGVAIGGGIAVDMKRVKARKDAVVDQFRNGLTGALEGAANCTLYRGHARFSSPREVEVGDERLRAERIFINVGGRAVGAGDARPRPGSLPDQHVDDGGRFSAAASGGHRRQLYRARIRADVPALRQRGHDRRDGIAADPA